MEKDLYNKKHLGKVYFVENDLLIENVWLTITEDEMYFETSAPLPSKQTWKLITGSFNKIGGDITLLNCDTRGGSFSGSGGSLQKVFFRQLVQYRKLKLEDLSFKGIVLISPAFTRWVQQTERIEYSNNHLKIKIPERNVIAKIETEEFKLQIISDFAKMANGHEFQALHQMVIKVTLKELGTLEKLLEIATKIRKFILFATNANPEFSHITLLDKDKDKLPLLLKPKPLNDKKFSQNIKIRYLHTRKHLAKILISWLSDEKLELAIDLILSRQYNTTMSSSAFFFNTCVALESNFDRFKELNYKNHETNAQNRIDAISTLIEKTQLREWFENKAKFWKEPVLRRKFEKYKPTIKAIADLTFPHSTTKLLDCIVATRNDIAHRAESKNCFSDIELFLAGKLLEFTFKIELLKYYEIDVKSEANNLVRTASSHLRMLATMNNYNVPKKDDKPFKLKGK